jgi:predicted solute-binding protein
MWRIGCVQYLNARPLIHGWPGPVVFNHPATLCRMLAAGELEAAFVSSFEFLRDPVYSIVDGVAVGADGPVFSVFVAHRGAFEELQEIALDPASRTSVNLLRCLLAERGLQPRLIDGNAEVTKTRGRLLIGDQAIRFRERHGSELEYFDLAAEWKRATALPFVFALWLIRPEAENASALADQLRERCAHNLATLSAVVAAQSEFAPEFCERYFREWLRFRFGAAEKDGLLHFRALCEKHGLLPPNATHLRLI